MVNPIVHKLQVNAKKIEHDSVLFYINCVFNICGPVWFKKDGEQNIADGPIVYVILY